jgi:hypothetical protein
VIVWIWKADIILPLFTLLECRDSDGNYWTNGSSLCLDILSAMVTHSERVEQYFMSSRVFETLLGILSDRGPNTVNYSLYIAFFSLVRGLSLDSLRDNLFDTILVNPRLWTLAPPNDQIAVVAHWWDVLFPMYPSVAALRPFDYILNTALLFYPSVRLPLVSTDGIQVFPYDRVPAVRVHLREILLFLASHGFTTANFHNLFAQCLSFSDLKHSEFSVSVLRSIVENGPIFNASGLALDDLLVLRYLFPLGSPEIISDSVDCILSAHRSSHAKASLSGYLHLFLKEIQPHWINDEVFDHWLSLTNAGDTELFPYCAWFAVNSGPSVQERVLQATSHFKPAGRLDVDILWLMLLALRTTEPIIQCRLLEFFTNFSPPSAILYRLQVVCVIFDENEAVCFDFLNLLFQLQKISEEELVERSIGLILWRPRRVDQVMSAWFQEALQHSPFSIPIPTSHTFPKSLPIPADAFFSAFAPADIAVRYDLRLTANGSWIDLPRSIGMPCPFLEHMVNIFLTRSETDKFTCEPPLCPRELVSAVRATQTYFHQVTLRVGPEFDRAHRFLDTVLRSLRTFQMNHSQKLAQTRKRWAILWSFLSNQTGPWRSESDTEIYWKREQTPCFAFCPFKLKQNKSFCKHLDASRARDLGEANPVRKTAKSFQVRLAIADDIVIDAIDCTLVKPLHDVECQFRMCRQEIQLLTPRCNLKTIPLATLRTILLRTDCHQPRGLEFFTSNSPSYFVRFPPKIDPKQLAHRILNGCPKKSAVLTQHSSFRHFFAAQPCTREWVAGEMSNFEYLMHLNAFSGRTFNDISQYPVFPWVLQSYDILDLDNPAIFRDLSVPVGALNPRRLSDLASKYAEPTIDGRAPAFFSSGPISPLVVSLFLIRMEPFTTAHIQFQAGHFDAGDRLFCSIATTFATLLSDVREYWELSPEFFFSPEFLLNSNDFDLGKHRGTRIHDVALPPWAATAMEFVYLHRKALESPFVSDHIHQWIDLIWGVNQRNPDAHNVYDWHLYKSAWKEKGADPSEIEVHQRMVGQIPPQLFRHPHPARRPPTLEPKAPIAATLPEPVEAIFIHDHSPPILFLFSRSRGLVSTTLDFRNGETLHLSKRMAIETPTRIFAFPHSLIAELSLDTWVYIRNHGELRISAERTVVACASSEEFFSLSASDFTTAVYARKGGDPFWEFRSYHGPITCTAISDQFKLHVSATADGSLDLTSLATGESVRVIALGVVEPIAVFVTPCWGFVVTYASETVSGRVRYSLSVHNVNGMFVRKKMLDDAIGNICVFRSARAFDYIAFFMNHRLCVCEAFFLDVTHVPGGHVGGGVVGMGWVRALEAFVVVDTAQRVRIMPFTPDDFAGLKRN